MIDTQELLALHVSVFRREEIKPPTPVLPAIHFSAALKTLVLCHFFRLHITFAREVCQLFFSLSPMANCPCECDSKSTTNLEELPNTRVFVAAENRSVEVLELAALLLLKTGTFGAKNW